MKNFSLAAYYTNGMIFQRGRPVCIEGEAFAACELTAVMNGFTVTQAVQPGSFCLKLPAREACKGLTLTVSDGTDTITLNDIYIGEVWLTGGQSNMEWPLCICEPGEANPVKTNEDIRFYTVGRNLLTEYDKGYEWALCGDTGWVGCTPESAWHFSGVAYHFAHKLYEKLQIPIGIINCNLGGSSILSWLPEESFLQHADLRPFWDAQQKRIAETDPVAARESFYRGLDEVKPDWAGEKPNASGTEHQSVIVFTVSEPGPYYYQAPSALYEPMLKKVVRFPVKGMIWYQGETDSHPDGIRMYPHALAGLIENCKKQQHDKPDEYAFHMVQLAPWDDPGALSWPDFFDMQRRFLIDNPLYGLVTIGDVGGGTDIHPPRKQKVGERLAYAALTRQYNLPHEFCGPVAVGAKREGDLIRIRFTHAEGLCQKGELGVFEVVSGDGKIKEAKAEIRDGEVIVLLKGIDFDPVQVRYEYRQHPVIGLYNSADIPASVFLLEVR
jgi:sialate O-acetylesterase